MNLHGLVSPVVSAINPQVPATLQISTGSTIAEDGTRIPTYEKARTVTAQVQPLSSRDLRQLEGLNLGGNLVAIYLYGEVDGLVRSANKGGDLVTLTTPPNAGVWLVNQVLEQWPDWAKCACTLQNGG